MVRLILLLLLLPGCTRTFEIGRDGGPSGDGTISDGGRTLDGNGPLWDASSPRPTVAWAYAFGGRMHDYGSSIDIDRANDLLFFTGSFEGPADLGGGSLSSGARDIFLASYSTAGAHRWSKAFGSTTGDNDGGSDLAFGGSRLVITGYAGAGDIDFGGGPLAGGLEDVLVASFDGSGNHAWSKRWPSTSGFGGNGGGTIAIDDAGNICVGGRYSGSIDFGDGELEFIGDFNPFVLLLDSAGNVRWSRGASRGSGDFSGGGRATIAPDGTVYLSGEFMSSVDFGGESLQSIGGFDGYLARFERNGDHSWIRGIQSAGYDWPRELVADTANNIYMIADFGAELTLGATTLTPSGYRDALLASYAPNGDVRWAKQYGGEGSDGPQALAVDAAGNLYVGGDFQGTVDFGDGPHTALGPADLFILSLTPSGALRWSMTFGGDDSIGNAESISDIAVGADGRIYAVGSFRGSVDLGVTTLDSHGESDIFLLAVDPPAAARP